MSDYQAGNPALNGTEALIVLTGCSGGGKSTLATEMRRRGYPVMPEPGRQVVREELYIGGGARPWTDPVAFAKRCIARGMYFYNIAEVDVKPVIFDRAMPDSIAALKRMGAGEPVHDRIMADYRYAPRVLVVPPWREIFGNDRERQHDFNEAVSEHEDLTRFYADAGYHLVEISQDTVSARADSVEALVS